MNFSNNFKIWWWAILLTVLTVIGCIRFYIGGYYDFDVYLFIFWFILVLFPVISEISFFGFNIKKDLESMKSELKTCITDIKNNINYQPNIIINPTSEQARADEYKKKVKDEVTNDNDIVRHNENNSNTRKIFSLESNQEDGKIARQKKTQERIEKILKIETLVSSYLTSIYGNDYEQQMKIEDKNNGIKIVVDGLIRKDKKISEIIEIRVLTSKHFDHFYYIALKFVGKLFKLGIRIPLRFIVISEFMENNSAILIKNQVNQINFNKSINQFQPLASVQCFKLDEDNLVEVKPIYE